METESAYLNNLVVKEDADKIITIQSVSCLSWMVNILTKDLEEMGWTVKKFSKDYELIQSLHFQKGLKCHYFMIFCPWIISNLLPLLTNTNYIYWNLEQNNDGLSNHFSFIPETVFNQFLNNASLLIDYNDVNLKVWSVQKGLSFRKLPIPMPANCSSNEPWLKEKKHDTLFIGCLNERRLRLLPKDCYIPDKPVYGDELRDLMKDCKLLVNVHFYKDAIFERPRINEALCNGIMIVSEPPVDGDSEALVDYSELVYFGNVRSESAKLLDCYDEIYQQWKIKVEQRLPILRERYIRHLKLCLNNLLETRNNRVAVIKVNYGSYDNIRLPDLSHIKNSNYFSWFYVCDRSNGSNSSNGWNIKVVNVPVDDVPIRGNLARTQSRYIKYRSCHLDFLQDFDYVIYLDGSVDLNSPDMVSHINKIIKDNPDNIFFSYLHYCRNNIYDEMDLSVKLKKYQNEDLVNQVKHYHLYGHSYRLFECGIFMYKMCDKTKDFFMDWYQQFIYWGTQDQLSVDYCFKKNNIEPVILNDDIWKFGELEGSIWQNRIFGKVRPHNYQLKNDSNSESEYI